MSTARQITEDELNARRSRTVVWVVTISTIGLIFDGYDLVVYGAVVSTFLKDPTQIGEVTPALAGTLGSYALIGTLVGALLAGSVGDIVGRRKVMLTAYAWFSVGMLVTALVSNSTMFGVMRFVTGLGVGALVATTGALVAEIAPAGKKNLCNAITYSGVPIGSLLSALLAIMLLDSIGWRGMFMIGASPLLVLLPLAIFRMPESVAWLVSRGKIDQARALSERTGVPLPEAPTAAQEAAKREKVGFAGLFSRGYWLPTILLGFMSASALMLVYALNTWLPVLMEGAGFNTKGSLSFLLVLNGGAIVGALIGSRVADRFGPKPVVVASFVIGAGAMLLMTLSLPLALLLIFVSIVGLGTSGTQILIYGFTAGYYPTPMRGAGVAWCAGFGRLGGVAGPLLGGFLLAAGLAVSTIFFVLAGIGMVGALITLLVQRPNRPMEIHSTPIEPSAAATS
ncbi:MFS transporter [Nakamurella sp.]|uniref:MFS transporter n=1 Tax=Nakamurella sp. TaxID=1869182 RepID=UPI0037835FDD